jgi:hypothetical protein
VKKLVGMAVVLADVMFRSPSSRDASRSIARAFEFSSIASGVILPGGAAWIAALRDVAINAFVS